MKYKLLAAFSLCCLILQPVKAQNSGTVVPGAVSPGLRGADTLEVLAFRRLLNFISTESKGAKKSDINMDSLKSLSEVHFLSNPVQAIGSSFTQENTSYDNFLPQVYHREGLQGSPFFLTAYVSGLVVNQIDTVIDKPDYLYNYDKVSGNLLLKRGNESPIAVNRNQVKYFCLKADKGGYIFERVMLINPNDYFQVLFKGLKYSLYKQIKSKFIPANQKTDGYSSAGKDFDEYRDLYTFFIVDQKKGEPVEFELSKKSIRKALPAENAFIEQYFKDHKGEDMDELYVQHLIEKLNN